MKDKKNLVVILVPSAKSKLYKKKIPYLYLNIGLVFGLILVFVISFVFFKFISLSMQMDRLDQLAKENSELNRINSKLQAELDNFAQRFEGLNSIKRKLYNMLNITTSEVGIGDFPEPNNMDSRYPQALIEKTNYMAEQLEKHFNQIEPEVKKQVTRLASIPSIWPVKGYITSYMGHRIDPFTKKKAFHPGVDISNRLGTPIVATADGIAIRVEQVTRDSRRKGMGNIVVIEHRFGYKTKYGHLDKIAIKRLQRIKRGDIIGYMGNTGRATGTHLHYEVIYNGVNKNPLGHMLDN